MPRPSVVGPALRDDDSAPLDLACTERIDRPLLASGEHVSQTLEVTA